MLIVFGNESHYQKQYIYQSDDQEKPTISLEQVGQKLKITATDNKKMQYLTYKWNDGELTRIDVSQNQNDDQTVIETEIDVPNGNNKITITAVDDKDNRAIETRQITTVDAPGLEIWTSGTNLVMHVSDSNGLDKLSVTIDGQTQDTADQLKNKKDETVSLNLAPGKHTISVEITNIYGKKTTKSLAASI